MICQSLHCVYRSNTFTIQHHIFYSPGKIFRSFSNVMANKYLNARGCIIAVATGIFVNVIIQLLQQLVDDTF